MPSKNDWEALLKIEGLKHIVLNLNEDHRLILNLLGQHYSAFYS
jgi:hypothetical protein